MTAEFRHIVFNESEVLRIVTEHFKRTIGPLPSEI